MNMKEFFLDILDAFLKALIIVFILYFTFWPIKIEGYSMKPTFLSGDRVIMSRVMINLNLFDRGDIVISEIEEDGINKKIIKRVVAIPGDHVLIENGNMYINNKKQYIYSNTYTYYNLDIILDAQEFFLLGDNALVSIDSRNFGIIQKNQIVGRVILRWYPFNNIKIY